jgi:TPP-dependent indolepyruvate ferredoxin oxidoreductase alpha subunit
MKKLLIGNEAIARGAYEAGATVATAYPGTPSTEIVNSFAQFEDVYAEWSPNEKVALEVGAGASIAGARTLVAMKHVGVNVAADPLYSFSYTGVNGGLVIVSADDPDCIPRRMNRTTGVTAGLQNAGDRAIRQPGSSGLYKTGFRYKRAVRYHGYAEDYHAAGSFPDHGGDR